MTGQPYAGADQTVPPYFELNYHQNQVHYQCHACQVQRIQTSSSQESRLQGYSKSTETMTEDKIAEGLAQKHTKKKDTHNIENIVEF